MYSLRRSIGRGRSVEEGLGDVMNILGELGGASVVDRVEQTSTKRPLLDKALLARDPDDGLSLLMYAARWGRKDWFTHLVGYIRRQVRVAAKLVLRYSASQTSGGAKPV